MCSQFILGTSSTTLSILVFLVIYLVPFLFYQKVNESSRSKSPLCIHGDINKESSQDLRSVCRLKYMTSCLFTNLYIFHGEAAGL